MEYFVLKILLNYILKIKYGTIWVLTVAGCPEDKSRISLDVGRDRPDISSGRSQYFIDILTVKQAASVQQENYKFSLT